MTNTSELLIRTASFMAGSIFCQVIMTSPASILTGSLLFCGRFGSDCRGVVLHFVGNIQALHPVAQRMAADFQLVGGPAEVVMVLLEHCADQLAFELGHDLI